MMPRPSEINPALLAAVCAWSIGIVIAFLLWGLGELREHRRQRAYRDALARGDLEEMHRLMGFEP